MWTKRLHKGCELSRQHPEVISEPRWPRWSGGRCRESDAMGGWARSPGQDSCKSRTPSCFLPLWFSNSYSLSFLCLSPSFAVCSDPRGMSTFLIPSPSLPHPRSLKIAALLNRLSLSFICHSPHHAPHSPALSVFYLFSLLPPPSLLNAHIALALHASMHCSAVISVHTFQLHL